METSYITFHGLSRINDIAIKNKNALFYDSTIGENIFFDGNILDILKSVNPSIGIISCHKNLANKIMTSTNLNVIQNIIIPWQASHAKIFNYEISENTHYPDVFEKIKELKFTADCYLVGAGFLGKIYCDFIKSQGKVALDVGAILDAFAGFNTRPSIWNVYNSKKYFEIQ